MYTKACVIFTKELKIQCLKFALIRNYFGKRANHQDRVYLHIFKTHKHIDIFKGCFEERLLAPKKILLPQFSRKNLIGEAMISFNLSLIVKIILKRRYVFNKLSILRLTMSLIFSLYT